MAKAKAAASLVAEESVESLNLPAEVAVVVERALDAVVVRPAPMIQHGDVQVAVVDYFVVVEQNGVD